MTPYFPERKTTFDAGDPLEIALLFNATACGTCTFFWPEDTTQQPYGPYPGYDVTANTPATNPSDGKQAYVWLNGVTSNAGFPTGEVMDGCRKAPIMTIGINPNLTAFSPGSQGTSWAYPQFTSDNGTDVWTKYAFYYRYRSVYQEHFDFTTVKGYVSPQGKILAAKDGYVESAIRTTDAPSYSITVQYDGDPHPTIIKLPSTPGESPYVLFCNVGSHVKFKAGDLIAGRLSIPVGLHLPVYQQQITYYTQFLPALDVLKQYLSTVGVGDADLQMGEDVCQLDMVACASPHWTDQFLGGSYSTENTVIHNCVSKNAWAIKQLVQTKPVVLFLVGESSYDMFAQAFGHCIRKKTPLPPKPEDGAFTLFRQMLDSTDPCLFEFSTTVGAQTYSLSTRLIVSPHFSYSSSFVPQFRMSDAALADFSHAYADCFAFLSKHPGVQLTKGDGQGNFASIALTSGADATLAALKSQYAKAYAVLEPLFYDVHNEMGKALVDLYIEGKLSYVGPADGKRGYLTRTEGACHFCVNDHWQFPLGCPYNKNTQAAPPAGFLEQVAAQIVEGSHTAPALEWAQSLFRER